jgi:signal transduction histidine kinase
MLENASKTAEPSSSELDVMYEICRVITRAIETDITLDEVIGLARKVFVFDNVVLYLQQQRNNLEPSYARALGRGRTAEADLAWGEATATQALSSGEVVIRREVDSDIANDRMRLRYYLGVPMRVGDHEMGALVFIRYGGPPFTPDQVHIGEFIAAQIAQLLEHQQLVNRLSTIEAERRLERVQDDFVATISHELRTPLGFIKGYATSLLREDTIWDEETRREFLTIIDEEADRLRELIDNLLDSSRLQSGTLRMEFQPVRLDTMLRDMVLRARSFNEKLPVELELQATRLQVQADPTRMAQVFDNLLNNAAKYAPGAKVTITLTAEDNMAHISVRDEGPGISAHHLQNIFTRFYRIPGGNTSVRGTGLGLFICRRIIHTHSGEITAESTVGEGTTFHIYLPCEQIESD